MGSNRLFGTNGIRGVVNQNLTPEFVLKIAEAIGTFFKQGNILIGFDGRTSNIMFTNAMTSGLLSTGCNVYNVGMVPTPCIQYATKKHKMDGSIMITASHNPPDYNGIKVMGCDGVELPRQKEKKIEKNYSRNISNHVNWDKIGNKFSFSNILNEYKSAILGHIDECLIKKKQYKVVVDAANGVGGLITPSLLRELNCRVITINSNIDGTFPNRLPEPTQNNLQDLSAIIVGTRADFGVAFDGDADRSIFVDEKGDIHWGDRTFALIEREFLKSNPNSKIITPVSSSQVVKEIADEYNGKVIITKVGSTIVSQTMKKMRAKLGGEENGGVFYGPHQPVRDGAMATALILNIMAKTNETLSQLLNSIPNYYLKKDKIECPNEKKGFVFAELISQVEYLSPETIDGVKIFFQDRSSILIRPSGTEPIYRLFAEAKNRERTSELIHEFKSKLHHIIKSIS